MMYVEHSGSGKFQAQEQAASTIRQLSNTILQLGQPKDDPEKTTRRATDPVTPNGTRRQRFGADNSACRQLAVNIDLVYHLRTKSCERDPDVEDWPCEYKVRELNSEQQADAERAEWVATRFKRFSLAFFAEFSLVRPVLLMTLESSLGYSLSTTSVVTLLFALLIIYFTKVGERDVVVIAAAYAAVLVRLAILDL